MQPGWYPDPAGRYEHRYFNGSGWTADVATDGARLVDPFGAGPAPVPAAALPPTPAAQAGGSGLATAAMTLGIVGAGFGLLMVFFYLAFPLGLLALVLGLVARRQSRASGGLGARQAMTAVILGPIAIVLSGIGLALLWDEMAQAWRDAITQVPYEVEIDACSVSDSVATATGTITNLSRASHRYDVLVDVVPRGSSEKVGTGVAVVGVLEPGELGDFSVSVPLDSGTDVRCSVERVRIS